MNSAQGGKISGQKMLEFTKNSVCINGHKRNHSVKTPDYSTSKFVQ